MEDTIKKIFKINLDIIFESNITIEEREYVIEKIKELDMFVMKEKTKIPLYKNFFMEFDRNYVYEKLSTEKYPNEYFLFKNVTLYIGPGQTKGYSMTLEDFTSDTYKKRLEDLTNDVLNIKKESNWSLLSIKDLLDVDHKKQTDKADSYFLLGNYLEACKIYSKYKLEDDFSHYTMEMEVYCRLLAFLNPYQTLIHLTNTNFVNSFYHHRLVLVLLLLEQNDFCYRISRLLIEPFKMVVDLELSKRFFNSTNYYRKATEMLFFCILYYKELDFPCDELIECFFMKTKGDIELLKIPIDFLNRLESSQDYPIITKNNDILIFRQFENSLNSLLFINDKDLKILKGDKVYILYFCDTLNTSGDLKIFKCIDSEIRISSLMLRHVIFDCDISLNVASTEHIFSLEDLMKKLNIDKKPLQIKEVQFLEDGEINIEKGDNVVFCRSYSDTPNYIKGFTYDSVHNVYQYQSYELKIDLKDKIICDGYTLRSNDIMLRFDEVGMFYKKITIKKVNKRYTMYLKFIVSQFFSFRFSWSKILPTVLSLNIQSYFNEETEINISKLMNSDDGTLQSIFMIKGELITGNKGILEGDTKSPRKVLDISLSDDNSLMRFKKEVLGIQEPFIEETYAELPELNSPVDSSLCFNEYFITHKSVVAKLKGGRTIQMAPTSPGPYCINIKTHEMSFSVPFKVSFEKELTHPLIYILSSSLIKRNCYVKLFCIVNNYFKEPISIRVESKTIEIEEKVFNCQPSTSRICEIRCRFMQAKKYDENDFRVTVVDKNNEFYKFDLFVDLVFSELDN